MAPTLSRLQLVSRWPVGRVSLTSFPSKRSGEEKNEEKSDSPQDSQDSTVLVLKDNCMGTLSRRSTVFPSASSDFSLGASGCLIASLS